MHNIMTPKSACSDRKLHPPIIFEHVGPYSQRDFKSRLTKHDFNDFLIGDKINT